MDYPVKRNLDGCYFRVTRDDKVENVCFTDLTPEEREKIIRDRSAEWLSSLLCHVADRYRTVADELDIELVHDQSEYSAWELSGESRNTFTTNPPLRCKIQAVLFSAMIQTNCMNLCC